MDHSSVLVILLSYLSAFLATSLALSAWPRKGVYWARPFAVLMMALAQWSLALGLELSSGDASGARFWRMMQIVGPAVAPVAWLIFIDFYGENAALTRHGRRRLLYLIPLVTLILAATNTRHGLLWQTWSARALPIYGSWHIVQLAYAVLLVITGLLYISYSRWKSDEAQRPYAIVMLGGLLPAAGYLLQVLNATAGTEAAILPYFLFAAVALLAWTVRNHQLLEIIPIARETVFNSMPDGVIVVNNQERIVEVNPAAERILQTVASTLLGSRFVEAFPQWAEMWYEGIIRGQFGAAIQLQVSGEARYFDMSLTPIHGRTGRLNGRLVILRDTTMHVLTERELDAGRQLFAKLVAVARATAENADLQATLQNALDVTTSLTAAEYGSLFLLDSHGRVTHSILARGKTAPGSRERIVGKVMDEGVAGWAVRNRATALIPDTSKDERWVTFPDQPYVARSVLVTPITRATDVPGVLTLQHSLPGFFDDEDEALLKAASDQMALALQNAQLFEQQRQLAARQQTLFETLRTLGRHLQPQTLMHQATETIAAHTGWQAVGILAADDQVGALRLVAGSGSLAGHVGAVVERANEILAQADDGPGLSSALEVTLYWTDQFAPLLPNVLVVPLRQATNVLGWLAMQVDPSETASDHEKQLAESLAETVALAMANARLFQAVAEEHGKLRALIESNRDGIVLVGNDGHILFLNERALRLLDRDDRPEAWLDRPLVELLHSLGESAAPFLRAAQAEITRAEQGDLADGDGELEINKRSLRWQNLPINSASAIVGRLIMLEDVTQERAVERMREDLTHTMVHDLRNPLNILAGSLALISEYAGDSLNRRGADLLRIARDSTDRMLGLVTGILDISRLESGKVPLERERFALRPLLARMLDSQATLAREKGLTLTYTVDTANGEAASELYADRGLVERILQNLVGNAIKFTPKGGVVAVSAGPAEQAGMILIRVADTGPGIPPELLECLFDKFVAGAGAGKGSGLGLSFCRMAVDAHGGAIWVENNREQGATFHFTLPLAMQRMGQAVA